VGGFTVTPSIENRLPQISHQPVIISCVNIDVPIVAQIQDQTNRVKSAALFYRQKGTEEYQQLNMIRSFGDTYQATIPSSAVTEQGVDYYIEAFDDFDVRSVTDVLEITIQDEPVLNEAVTNLRPVNGVTDVDVPIRFSWAGSPNALTYDFYIWPSSESLPGQPTAAGLTQVSYIFSNRDINYGQEYSWQVVARDACTSVASDVQQITFRQLPDLVVKNIITPTSTTSESTVDIEWEIENVGSGPTMTANWYEALYFSASPVFDPNEALLVKSLAGIGALAPGEAYRQATTFELPQGIAGDYYFFVEVDRGRRIIEANEENNIGVQVDPLVVELKPAPELEITSVIAPRNTFSEQSIEVRWTVGNTGAVKTDNPSWVDAVFLSQEEEIDPSQRTPLAFFRQNQILEPGESYESRKMVTLPQGIQGTYYLFVQTDFRDQVFEAAGNNLLRSDSISVILLPPPDLVVTEVNVRESASNNESISITWEVQNQGGGEIADERWTDNIYLSTSEDGTQDLISLGSVSFSDSLGLDEIYQAQKSVVIPKNITGDYFVFVETDAGNSVFEYESDDNNQGRSEDPISILTPDLIVSAIDIPESANSGTFVTVDWTVANQGQGALVNQSWADAVYLSPTTTITEESLLLTRSFSQTSIVAGSGLDKSTRIQLPQGIEGNYYILVETDHRANIFENNADNNNLLASAQPLTVNLSDWADLTVGPFTIQDSARAGEPLPINFTVTNAGLAEASGTLWEDKVYISMDSVWNSAKATLLSTLTRSQGLAPEGGYSVQTSPIIPMLSLMEPGVTQADCYIYVKTDAQDAVYEYTDETNNITRSNPVYVVCPGPVNLRMDWVSSNKQTVKSGESLSASWQVTNLGSKTQFWDYELWYDGIYLSEDTIWDSSDIFVTDQVIRGPLEKGETYQASLTYRLPDGVFGEFYQLMVADHKDNNSEKDFSDNYQYIQVTNEQGETLPQEPISITLTASPDLVIESIDVPAAAVAGQPIQVVWSIANQGDTVTLEPSWTDKFYLSDNFTLDGGDIPLATRIQRRSLEIGSSYQDTMEVFLPSNAEGNYVLIFKTDDRNTLYEHNGEGDNVIANQILVTRADPSDLVATNLSAPDTIVAGESIDISWNLFNQGDNLATGFTSEAVFLSTDDQLDVGDVRLGTLEKTIRLAPLGETERGLSAFADNLALGTYHLFVQADLKNNINETNEENNISKSDRLVIVTVPDLPLFTTVSDTLLNERRKYYHIAVPDSLTGETLLISLDGEDNAVNTLYLRYGDVPTPVNYDLKFNIPVSPDQEIVVPELQAGDYYLMMTGQVPEKQEQLVSLSTRLIPFELRLVDASQGGNSGMVTVKMEGAKFTNDMTISLENPELGSISAVRYEWKNPLLLYATFDLRDAPVGMYQAMLEKPDGNTAELAEAFEVVPGLVKGLTVKSGAGGGSNQGGPATGKAFVCCDRELDFSGQTVIGDYLPANTRINRIVSMTFYVENTGNVDVPVPERYMISVEGAPLGLNVKELEEEKLDAFLRFQEKDGPEHVLRPGARSVVTLYTKAVTRLRFRMIKQ
jgi:hypothetical protein